MRKHIQINIRPNTVAFFLAAITALLILAHSAGLVWEAFHGKELGRDLIKRFDLGREGNIPTWFSSTLLLLAALLQGLIAAITRIRQEPYLAHWIFLALIFFFLSCDETAQIHEWTVAHVYSIAKIPFFQFIGWVVPYSLLLILFGAAYLRFFLHLPNRIMMLFAAAGAVFVGGALGMELLTAAIGRVVFEGKIHFLFNIVEEALEMAGIIILIYALLSYLSLKIHQVSFEFGTSGLHPEGR